MWQKLHSVKTEELENTRFHVHQAVQLVSAAPRAYLPPSENDRTGQLYWDTSSMSLKSSPFGPQGQISISLDISQLILTIHGEDNHVEHLVLSGLTYPLAFGWMKIKLESFGLDPDLFHDNAPYKIPFYGFGPNKEFNVSNYKTFDEIAKYFSNAIHIFHQLRDRFSGKEIYCSPQNLNILCELENDIILGFSPGDEFYVEPFFYLQLPHYVRTDESLPELPEIGLWHTKEWLGAVMIVNQFIKNDMEKEEWAVLDFFQKNYSIVSQMIH